MTTPKDVRELVHKLSSLGVKSDVLNSVLVHLGSNPDNPDLWVGLATALREEGNYRGALETYDAAIQRFPDSISFKLWSNRGYVLLTWEHYKDALECFRRALAIDPDYVRAIFFTARTYELLHEFKNAIELYKEVLKKAPLDYMAWNNLGLCQHQIGQEKEAIHCYQEAIRLSPTHEDSLYNLATLYAAREEFTQAEPYVSQLLELSPNDEEIQSLSSLVLQRKRPTIYVPGTYTMDNFNVMDMDELEEQCRHTSNNPRSVFLSYGWDDNDHKQWVLDLARDLEAHQFQVILDQIQDLNVGQTMAWGMCCKNILMIATPRYMESTLMGLGSSKTSSHSFAYTSLLDVEGHPSFKEGWSMDENQMIILNEANFSQVATLYRSGNDCYCSYPILDFSNGCSYDRSLSNLIQFLREPSLTTWSRSHEPIIWQESTTGDLAPQGELVALRDYHLKSNFLGVTFWRLSDRESFTYRPSTNDGKATIKTEVHLWEVAMKDFKGI